MAKRKTGMSSNKIVPHPRKTKKRLEIKKVMLAAKAGKKARPKFK